MKVRSVVVAASLLVCAACSSKDAGAPSGSARTTEAAPLPPKPAPAPPPPRPRTGVEGQFTVFLEENAALGAAITGASNAEAARKAFEARKAKVKEAYDAVKLLPDDSVAEATVIEFTDNVTNTLSSICSLGLGNGAEPDRYNAICMDYRKLLDLE